MNIDISNVTMKAIVISPEAIEWQGEITAVEATNSEGDFSVMPDHTRFITLIHDKPITFFLPDDRVKTFQYSAAVLVVDDNVVTIYIHATDS